MSLQVLLVREGLHLSAADPISLETLQGIGQHETVVATIRRARNIRHHRKLFALLQAIYPHQTQFATIEDLLNTLKVATGLFDTGKTIDGIPFMMPRSISFASMTQASFEQFYERVVDIITTKIVPGIGRDDLAREVDIILGHR